MPRSSRHKLHKHSKHSSKDYSDSEEDVVKMKEKSSKNQDSASAEKRKISSQVLDSLDLSGHGNGEVSEEFVSTKRRKEKSGVNVGSDRWNGGGVERSDSDSDSNMDSETCKGKSLRTESKSKSKRYGTGSAGEKKDDNLMMEREESKSKGEESRRKSERDSSSVRKEGKELKDKESRSEKEKNGGQESKSGDAVLKLVDTDVRKKQGSQLGDFSDKRQGKRAREHSERTVQEELQNPELEKEAEKRIRRRREGSSEGDKQYDDSVEDDGRLLSSRGDRAKDVKFRDGKLKDGSHADKYQEDSCKDGKRRDDKYQDGADKDNKYQDDKHREDGEKNAKRRLSKHHEDGDRGNRRKYEKDRDNGERDNRRKDDKYRLEFDDQRVDKYHEDGSKNSRRNEGRYLEDAEKDIKYVDERYNDDGDKDDRLRDNYYKDDGNRDHRCEEEKYRGDIERQSRHKNSKQGDEFDREKRMKDAKYRDELTSRDRSDERCDHKRSRDDGYAVEHHSRKSCLYDDSPARDVGTAKHRDDEVRRRIDEKDDYGDSRSRGTRDQRSNAEKRSSTGARMDQVTDRVQNRRQSSPTTSSHTPRDHHYRVQKQDESKYRDYNYEARVQHTISASGDYSGAVGEFEKIASRSLEKTGTKDDDRLAGLSVERRLKPDIRSSPFVDKSPSSSNDRRLFSKPDLRRSIIVEESTQRSGGSRDVKEFSGKEGRGSRDPADEFLPAEAGTLSVSSSFTRSNNFSSSSKSLAPPPLFRGVDSPLLSGSVEDDGRGKSSIHHRRIIDPNMGRIQGNAWRGVPSWPSPVGNGFLPFPHGPPPVSFHSVMQPFPAPPMFGVRPSMDLSHPVAPYLMPGADRFSGPGRPMGWRNQVDDSCPPFHAWDASNPVFGDESHIYGRSDWDHPRDLSGSGGWGSSDLLGGPNKNATSEMPFSEKGNNSVRSADEAMGDESSLPSKNEPAIADQQVKSIDISLSTKNSEKNDFDAPPVTSQQISDVKMMSRTDDVPLFHVYLLKLDISSDITEPECFSKCTGLIDVDQCIYSDVDGAKVLCMEGAIEAKMTSDKLLNDTMLRSTDNSVLQKSTSLYQRQKQNLMAGDGNELNVTSKVTRQLDHEDQNVGDDRTEKLCTIDNMQAVEYAIPVQEDPQESLEIDQTVSNALKISTEPASSDLVFDEGDLQENNVEEKALSPLPSGVKAVSMEFAINNEELKLLDAKCGSADVSSEAIMMPELVNLNRIHHSPESTH